MRAVRECLKGGIVESENDQSWSCYPQGLMPTRRAFLSTLVAAAATAGTSFPSAALAQDLSPGDELIPLDSPTARVYCPAINRAISAIKVIVEIVRHTVQTRTVQTEVFEVGKAGGSREW